MARIPLTSGFAIIPEGEYILKITDVKYNEPFGKMEVRFKSQEGHSHIERYSLLDKEGDPNDGALNAFSYMARNATGDWECDDIDEQDLVGKYLIAEVYHTQVDSTKNPGKVNTYAHINVKGHAEGFTTDSDSAPAPAATSAKTTVDLASLLG